MLIILKLSLWTSLMFSCRAQDPEISEKIIDSVEFQESRGSYQVKDNGYCIGLMQIDSRFAPVPKHLLRIPYVNRVVGTRILRNLKRRANGDMSKALAAYNCGTAGLYGKCGFNYASAVLGRNIHYPRLNISSCSIMGNAINSYLDNKDYLIRWRNKKWRYQHLHQLRLQR